MNNYLTIEGFEKLTLQQMFDMSLAHIRKTRQKSVLLASPLHTDGRCVYSGTGCAAAPFLRPECRAQADETGGLTSAWSILARHGKVPPHNKEFVTELQGCHDGNPAGEGFMEGFEFRMQFLARESGLVYSPE